MRGNDVGYQTVFLRFILRYHNDTLSDDRPCPEGSFDLLQFNTEAADLDPKVFSSKMLKTSVSAHTTQISRSISRLIAPCWIQNKGCTRQIWISPIPERKITTPDRDFP